MFQFTENGISQKTARDSKTWTIPELLETPDPLPGEALTERNAAMRQVVDLAADMYDELSETALLRYDFWKQLLPNRISEQQFKYTTTVTNTAHWELTINPLGLFYKDVSGKLGKTNETATCPTRRSIGFHR